MTKAMYKHFFDRLLGNGQHHIIYTAFILFFIFLTTYLCFLILQGNVPGRDALKYLSLVNSAKETWFLKYDSKEGVPPPLLIMILIHANHFFDIPTETFGMAICLFCGAMCSVLVFCGCWILSKRYLLSLLSGVLFFLIPGIRDISVDILRDAPSILFNLIGVVFFICFAKKRKRLDLMICGLATSFSIGFRYENIEFLYIFPILVLYLVFLEKNTLFKKMISFGERMLLFFAGVLIGMQTIILICFRSNYYSHEILSKIFGIYLPRLL